MPRLILASSSPRRVEVLRNAGFDFEIMPARVDESARPGEAPVALAERLARAKAKDVASRLAPETDAAVLGADTVVVSDEGELLGKPSSPADAVAMLEKLSARPHDVITGVALVSAGGSRARVAHELTRVFFRALTREEIEGYVATGEPLDKAGAYAIQGGAGRFITRIEGCYFNVMGLPLSLVDCLLREWRSG
ncbi:MAG: Maf family protein [Candidatus Acidiferrales bacterium]